MVDMGISSNIMKYPSPQCYMTFHDMIIYSDTLYLSDILNRDRITERDLITSFWEVSIEQIQRVWLAHRGGLRLRTPGPVQYATFICSYVET